MQTKMLPCQRRICKRSDQPKIERLVNNDARLIYYLGSFLCSMISLSSFFTCLSFILSFLMLDITTNSAPQNICNLFTSTQDIHQYNRRSASSSNYYINHSRLNHHKNSFSIVGAKVWNTIPESYRRLPKHIFKKKIQALLFVTLETLDSYADTSTLISEIKRHLNYNSIIIYNIFSSLFISFFLS